MYARGPRALRRALGEEGWKKYKKKTNSLKVLEWRKRAKRKLIEYKGGRCEICGYNNDCPAAYDFHHRDPTKKEFGIGQKGVTYGIERLKREVDKCMLLCKNCHAEIHYREFEEESDSNIRARREEIERIRAEALTPSVTEGVRS